MKQPNSFCLVLSGHYDRDPGLDQYLLVLIDCLKGQVNEWRCTSSHTKGQQRGDQHKRGGLIPPVHHVSNLNKWEVDLEPIYLPRRKGIQGNFYRILPYSVVTLAGAARSDFGIHLDANVPGSLGCPVMNQVNWADFEETIARTRAEHKLKTIPFFPLYS